MNSTSQKGMTSVEFNLICLLMLIVCLGVLLAGALSPWLHPLGTAGIAIASVAVATLISAWREVPWLGSRNSGN